MQMTALADTGRTTSRLGYGCSSVMGGMGRAESLRVLEWAFDAGVRHFDVAPMYGYGAAEACLGEFVGRHAGVVTVTTKFGIAPPARVGALQLARRVAKPLLNAVPALKKRAQRAAAAAAGPAAPRDLSPALARESLEKSLRALRVECIDLFLLHDVTANELRGNEPLLRMLETAKADGKIRAFGVGSEREQVALIRGESPAFARVTQCEWSVFAPVSEAGGFVIHHRSLAHNWRRLRQYLHANADVAREWSAVCDADLRDGTVLSTLMMRAALLAYPDGVVLFSSKAKEHIRQNASIADAAQLDAASNMLYRLVQQNLAEIPAEQDA